MAERKQGTKRRCKRQRTRRPESEIKKAINFRAYPDDIALVQEHYGTHQKFWDSMIEKLKEQGLDGFDSWKG